MDCEQARDAVSRKQRGRLDSGLALALKSHLGSCVGCQAFASEQDALTELLIQKLPQFAAPVALKRALRASLQERRASSGNRTPVPQRRQRQWVGVAAIAACVCAMLAVVLLRAQLQGQSRTNEVAIELAEEHVRVLAGEPLSQITGGLHEVKPWFAGKLDFAPDVTFAGDADFPLVGGAITKFFDHRAAVFVFHRRLHVISLFVARAEHLTLQAEGKIRGFHYRSWTMGDEELVAISDLNADELRSFCERLQGANR